MAARRRFTAEFKARVALAALRGDKTIQEIAAQAQGTPEPGEQLEAPGVDPPRSPRPKFEPTSPTFRFNTASCTWSRLWPFD